MGWALHRQKMADGEERIASLDGRPVLVPARNGVPEHLKFTLDGDAYRDAGERWEVRAGAMEASATLVLAGRGCGLRVLRGDLVAQPGLTHTTCDGEERRLYRGQHGIETIVLVGTAGSVTLAALQWCREQDITLLSVDREGRISGVVSPVSPAAAHLRRLQYTLLPLHLARMLVLWKLRECCRDERSSQLEEYARRCEDAAPVETLRTVEGQAARVYWQSWEGLPLTWVGPPVPPLWHRFDGRISPLSQSGRHATHPVNAMLNFAYGVLAGHVERCIVSRGLDPAMGSLHAPKDGRPSLVYDLMEPLRPHVDARLLPWASSQSWRRIDFPVSVSGVVRLNPQLARCVVIVASLPAAAVEGVLDAYVGFLRSSAGPRVGDPERSRARAGRALGKRQKRLTRA